MADLMEGQQGMGVRLKDTAGVGSLFKPGIARAGTEPSLNEY
jgi:hypothetical protein